MLMENHKKMEKKQFADQEFVVMVKNVKLLLKKCAVKYQD